MIEGKHFASVCFFLTTGHTFTFRHVRVEQDNETAITIQYAAMSDGLLKLAVFYKTHIAGVAYLPPLAGEEAAPRPNQSDDPGPTPHVHTTDCPCEPSAPDDWFAEWVRREGIVFPYEGAELGARNAFWAGVGKARREFAERASTK